MNFWMDVLAMTCFLALAGFFSGVETGIYVLNPMRYHVKLKEADREARLLERLLRNRSQLVSSLLVGTNLCIFLSTTFATKVTGHFYPGAGTVTAALLTTAYTATLVLIFAEMVPKNIYQRKSDTLVYSSARAFYICNLFFLPFVKALSLLTGAVNLFFGRRRTLESEFLTRKSVERHLTEGSGESVLTPAQVEMVRNILGLAAKRVSDAMIVLNEAVMIGVDADAACVARLVGKHGFSRMPAYRGSRANIVGVLNVFDVFYESAGASGDAPRTIEHLVRPVPFIGRDARIDQALASLREARQPMGVVVGARSEPLGIVTIKDLLEEITGEIRNW